MSIHQKGKWKNTDKELQKRFLAVRAAETRNLGWLLIFLGPPILGYFILQDSTIIGLSALLKFRLIPVVSLVLYGIFLFSPGAKNPRLLLLLHSLLLFSLSIMTIGRGYLVFSGTPFNHWQKAFSSSEILATFITIHLFSGLARPYFFFIAGIPLLFLVAVLGFKGDLGFETFSIIANSLYASIAISVVSILQENMRFQDFYRKNLMIRQNLELERIAGTDELTGMRNRRAGMAELNDTIKKAAAEQSPFTICFLDADGLKKVNDEFGHREGDSYLQTIAQIIKKILTPEDYSARMGGDEFILIFPGRRITEAEQTVKAIHQELRRLSLTHPFPLEVSHGLAEYDPASGHEAKDLLKLADSLMYQYKEAKRKEAE